MKLRDLFVSIGFDVDDKALGDLDRGLQKTKTLIFAVGAAAVASAGMLYKMAASVAEAGDKAAKTAGRMGINLELLQEYQYAAQLAGMSVQELNMNMEQFIRRAAEAADGSGESQAAYKELGISVKDLNGQVKSSDQLLAEVADRFAQIKDGSVKVRLAYDLFGRSGIGMINMLNQGSAAIAAQREEARRLGVVIGEQAARDAEKFQDDLLRAKSVIVGIKNEVGSGLLPVVIDLMVQFRQWVLYRREMISRGLEKAMHGMIVLMRWLYRTARTVVSVLADIVEMFGGIERAARLAGWAIGIMAGAYMLAAVGNLTLGIAKLAAGIRTLGNIAMVANAKVMAIPVLIGAAVAAIILILQDLYVFLNGGDSVIGRIGDKLFQKLVRAFIRIILFAKSKVAELMDLVQPLLDAIDKISSWFEKKNRADKEKFDNFLYSIADTLGMGVSGDTVRYYKVPQYSSVNVNAPISVNVPEGTPPAEVGRAVQNGVSDGIGRLLRDTAAQTEPVDLW